MAAFTSSFVFFSFSLQVSVTPTFRKFSGALIICSPVSGRLKLALGVRRFGVWEGKEGGGGGEGWSWEENEQGCAWKDESEKGGGRSGQLTQDYDWKLLRMGSDQEGWVSFSLAFSF